MNGPIPFSAGCLLEPTSFLVYEGAWLYPMGVAEKEPATVQCPTRAMTAGLTSFSKVPTRSRKFPHGSAWARPLLESIREIPLLFCVTSSCPARKQMEGTRRTAGCLGVAAAAISPARGFVFWDKPRTGHQGRLRHAGLTWLQGDSGSTIAGTLKWCHRPHPH